MLLHKLFVKNTLRIFEPKNHAKDNNSQRHVGFYWVL